MTACRSDDDDKQDTWFEMGRLMGLFHTLKAATEIDRYGEPTAGGPAFTDDAEKRALRELQLWRSILYQAAMGGLEGGPDGYASLSGGAVRTVMGDFASRLADLVRVADSAIGCGEDNDEPNTWPGWCKASEMLHLLESLSEIMTGWWGDTALVAEHPAAAAA